MNPYRTAARPLDAPAVTRWPAHVALWLALGVTGCGASNDALKAVRSGAEFADKAEPILVGAYRMQLEMCVALPEEAEARACVEKVQAHWEPLITLYDTARRDWCAVDAAIGRGLCP
jgi:hypothetical protein